MSTDQCQNPECNVPLAQREALPCLLNTSGSPDVIGSPCTHFQPATAPVNLMREARASVALDGETQMVRPRMERTMACEHYYIIRTDEDGGTEDGMFVDPGDNLRCGDCKEPLVVLPADAVEAVRADAEIVATTWHRMQAHQAGEEHMVVAIRMLETACAALLAALPKEADDD